MQTKDDLLECADLFRGLTGLEEVTLSYRIFGDTKKLRQLRGPSGITLDRFNAAMIWLASNWPAGADLPDRLLPYAPPPATPTQQPKDAA
jgi:hypothetical protein